MIKINDEYVIDVNKYYIPMCSKDNGYEPIGYFSNLKNAVMAVANHMAMHSLSVRDMSLDEAVRTLSATENNMLQAIWQLNG